MSVNNPCQFFCCCCFLTQPSFHSTPSHEVREMFRVELNKPPSYLISNTDDAFICAVSHTCGHCTSPFCSCWPTLLCADVRNQFEAKNKRKMLEEVVHRQTGLFSPERQLGHLLVSSVWRRKGPQPEHLGTQRGTTRSRSYKGTLSNSEKLERGTENLRAQTQTGAQNKAVVLW